MATKKQQDEAFVQHFIHYSKYRNVLRQIYGPADKVNSITTRQLLAMQSGIGDFDTPTTDEYQWKNRSYDIPPVEDL